MGEDATSEVRRATDNSLNADEQIRIQAVMDTETLIIGGGLSGLAVARELQRRHREVVPVV
jgi:glycerol-3-phosphate dehydrogenase